MNDLAGDLASMETKLKKTKRDLHQVAQDNSDKLRSLKALKKTKSHS